MAAEWIKMRTDLYRDPKVCVMADVIHGDVTGDAQRDVTGRNARYADSVTRRLTRNAVVGALVSVWGVSRIRGRRDGDDLILAGCAVAVLDDIADLPGFGAAMMSVGWAEESTDGVILPGFFNEFNADPRAAKRPAAERQKRYRERKKAEVDAQRDVTGDVTGDAQRDVTGDVTSRPREEKRREEEIHTPTGTETKPQKPAAEKKRKPDEHPLFAAFWDAYPRKVDKPDARDVFAKIDPDETLLAKMIAAISRARAGDEWREEGGKYIPYPAKWLRRRRWEDEPLAAPKPAEPIYVKLRDLEDTP